MCLATPARVKGINKDRALVDFGGVTREISLGILKGVKPNDHVLVHAGFAIGKIKKQEAQDTLQALAQLRAIAGK